MNIPYVKKYNELGEVTNPIKTIYMTTSPNRKQRRQHLQKVKYFGNVIIQKIIDVDKNGKRIVKTIKHDAATAFKPKQVTI